MSIPKVILLSGETLQREAAAVSGITPGHLIEIVAAGAQVHSAEGKRAPIQVADFADFVGNGIETAYVAGDTVKYMIPVAGSRLFMLLAAGENVAVNDRLVSNGDGTLREAVVAGSTADDTDGQLFMAVEAKNNASGATAVRVRVQVL